MLVACQGKRPGQSSIRLQQNLARTRCARPPTPCLDAIENRPSWLPRPRRVTAGRLTNPPNGSSPQTEQRTAGDGDGERTPALSWPLLSSSALAGGESNKHDRSTFTTRCTFQCNSNKALQWGLVYSPVSGLSGVRFRLPGKSQGFVKRPGSLSLNDITSSRILACIGGPWPSHHNGRSVPCPCHGILWCSSTTTVDPTDGQFGKKRNGFIDSHGQSETPLPPFHHGGHKTVAPRSGWRPAETPAAVKEGGQNTSGACSGGSAPSPDPA